MDPVIKRRQAIAEIIKQCEVENQEQLSRLLFEHAGIEANQSVISRDLKDMGVAKVKHQDKMVYELQAFDARREILRLGVVSIEHNEAMIVIKTLAGMADFIGDFVDTHAEELEIITTLAGENAVLVVPRTVRKIEQTVQRLKQLVFVKEVQE